MFFCGNKHLSVLVFVLIWSSAFASLKNTELRMGESFERIVTLFSRPWLEGMESIVRSSESSCAKEVAVMIEAVESGQLWALQMLDASSKIQSGLLKGNVRNLGMYDECVEANGQYNNVGIRGKHCSVSLLTVSNISSPVVYGANDRIILSLCVPSACNETQVEQIVDFTFNSTLEMSNLGLELNGASCARVGSEDFNDGEILAISIFLAIGAFLISCTICDFVRRCRPVEASDLTNTLAKFSLYTNALALLSTEGGEQMMPAIHGIRVLSMCWVIAGHHWLTLYLRPMVNVMDMLRWLDSWTSLCIVMAPFAVDTFLVISGFVMASLFLKALKSGRRINLPILYLHRYLRLTPCVAALMLFATSLLHRVANGPMWNTLLDIVEEPCRENWWLNLLYIQNFVNTRKMCLAYTWYLAVDMQLFCISPIVLCLLHRRPKYGLRLLACILIVSVLIPPISLAAKGYSNRIFSLRFDLGKILYDDFLNFYMPTYNRGCAYFLGILLGYDVVANKRHPSKINVRINWFITTVLMLFCCWATHRIFSTDAQYDIVLEIMFAATLRPFWSIAIAWIIYATTQGYGGPVTKFLSTPLFWPLSRISYSVFLVHVAVQAVKNANSRSSAVFANSVIFHEYWGDLALSIMVGFVFCLFFESPVLVLQKILFDHTEKSNQSTSVQNYSKKKD